MSDTEGLDYLQAGFDPSSLTVPRLRSILVSHNIAYPASAKKQQLIDIFTENILPQSRKILAARSRARRTSKGITNADRTEDSPVVGDEDLMPPPPTPRSRSARKTSSNIKVEDSESETPARSPVKRTPRASSKHARSADSETGIDLDGERKTPRRRRKSEAPQIKMEETEGETPRRPTLNAGAFSDDNPFQSGSSPPTSSEAKRKSLGASSSKDSSRRKSSSTTRRRTDVVQANDGIVVPTSRTFEIPVSQLNGLRDVDENGVEASEEFTPEEQLQLVSERSTDGDSALGPRRPKRNPSNRMSASGPIWVVLLTLLGGYATWYRQEKLAVGYCGVGRPAHQLVSANAALPDWAVVLAEPQCEPCPQHAYCYEQLKTTCETDFVEKPHPLSLGGLVPLPPTCEPDGEKVRRVKAVADRAVEQLRDRRAKWECGDLTDSAGAPVPTVEIDAEALKKEVSQKRRKGMTEAEFEELWHGAIGEITGREEVTSGVDGNTKALLLTSTSLARISLSCAIRRSFRLAVARHRLQLATLGLVVSLLLYARYKYASYAASVAAVPHLVSLTLDRLATQAALYAQDKETFPEAWISIGQLRDDVLRDEHSISKREALWSRVRRVVELNANVRASQREGRNGEISRVWEWIGAVGPIDAADRERARRKSGRVSWGTYGEGSSPVSGTDGGPEVVQAKWEEGRPIY
ncbi:MAG: inner nuclear membrane protein enriched at telomere/subtelomere region [Claussenomyces sp. TS43310]|nr:MAG: inner nuclear membrane protein enriched at telomere/subtelomere region [Claussenomyces sp. TS43310]